MASSYQPSANSFSLFPTFAPFMTKEKKTNLRPLLKWVLWVLVVQLVLVNISASVYAYKFTHFYEGVPPVAESSGVLGRTWKLFTGPRLFKMKEEPEPPFPYEQIRFNISDSIPIDCWYSSVDSARGCVILFHGITVNKAWLLREAAMFRHWGYNTLLVDFRGHGLSGGLNSSFGVEETEEVGKAFDYAISKGNSKIILFGVSMGAAVCIKSVAEGRVKPAALIADMPFGSLHHHIRSRARTLGFPSEPFGALVSFWIGVQQGYNGFSHDVRDYAKKLDCPVLVEWGKKDVFVTEEEISEVYANIPSSKKKLLVYPEADHESFLKLDPETWQKEVRQFLESLP